MSRVAAKDSFVATRLTALLTSIHGLQPWLRSYAADAAEKPSPIHSPSVFDSQLKLEHSRQIRLSGGLSEVGIGNVRIDASETNIIEEVERIRPEHQS